MITALYTAPRPARGQSRRESGRDGAGSGQAFCWAAPPRRDATRRPAARATQEIDYGRRGKGYVFGAFQPATGAALTWTAMRRTTANFVAFLEQTDAWIDAHVEHVYAILDNLSAHRATEVLLFALAHPRWEFVFQPKYAAYLNLIAPWWKILRSLALKGRRFATWEEICAAVAAATDSWNAHRHPFRWGHRRRHRPHRQSGIALVPSVV
ncbi:MAG TPA: transposase [Ktedonobacterales bacterium]